MDKPATVSPGFELLRRLARRHGVPARDAEDVAQEALLRGLDADTRIEPGGDPAPYRVTIAVNQARNHVRDARRRGEVLTSFDDGEIREERLTPEDLLRRRQQEELARQLLDRLAPRYRDLLIKHDLEGVPLAQIAAEQGLPLGTVRARHWRAHKELRVQRKRWQAQQRARGRDDSACVPLALGLGHRASRVASLGRLGVRILAQCALVLLTGAVVSAVPPSPDKESWLGAAAARAPATAPAAPVAPESSSSREGRNARAEAVVSSTPAASKATDRRPAPPASAARPAASERERGLINQARAAIEAHDPMADVEALRLLEAHAREFPRGRLAAEREALLKQIR
ncbi:MAG TPA: sigma-70 family RNA polymerase sigma factor [Sorangium sp.]|nr:sigma-70 family RNA polymerase sigma factor [Sorangium sp.]